MRISGDRDLKDILMRIFRKSAKRDRNLTDVDRARQLIAAIDAGGIPLDPAIITKIAESFGLEVSRTAHTDDTIERIRAALKRNNRQ
jgi:hypothetical protein